MKSSKNINSPEVGQQYRFTEETHLKGCIFLVTKNIYEGKILYGLIPLSSRYMGCSWSVLTTNINEIFGTHEESFELI
jgi:hypothetical protein